jgi:mersacidin/lichenicidin family type 2 lantibiotic
MTKKSDQKGWKRRGVLGAFGLGIAGTAGAKAKESSTMELSPEDIVRAWEDPTFREKLTDAQWAALPAHPAGKMTSGQFLGGRHAQVSWNACSGNSCSGNSCSGNSCSGNSCSGNSCSGNSCSGNSCSGNSCSGNSCSGYSCGGRPR